MVYGFYDNLILSGTKIISFDAAIMEQFYDNLILSGTKIYTMYYHR